MPTLRYVTLRYAPYALRYVRVGDKIIPSRFSVEMVDRAIHKMKRGKASGVDNLTCEHLHSSHPVVTDVITTLFNIMLKIGYLPNDFGVGLIVPIPKGDKRNHDKLDDFRGVTINCVISKIFEHCLYECCQSFFYSSDRQFGFKKNLGCQHAIYSLRKIVEHFTLNESTVYMGSLDLSKAFDRVSHDKLFMKLANRNVPKFLLEIFSKLV